MEIDMKSCLAVLLEYSGLLIILSVIILMLICLFNGCSTQPTQPICPCQTKVIAFVASWCGPCQRAKPALIALQASGVQVMIYDIDEHPEVARQYEVTSVPTFLIMYHDKTERTNSIQVVLRTLGR
jgi:thiol-disulfide isomerase/thioredoxin